MEYNPKTRTLYLGGNGCSDGIDVKYHPKSETISIGGWHGGCVGIMSEEIPLDLFLKTLNVPRKTLKKISENHEQRPKISKKQHC